MGGTLIVIFLSRYVIEDASKQVIYNCYCKSAESKEDLHRKDDFLMIFMIVVADS